MKVVINGIGSGINTWDNNLLKYLVKIGWKCTTLSDDGKGIPNDSNAYIAKNYAGCLIDKTVNGISLEEFLRTHNDFIEIVENNLLSNCSHLSVVEIPDNVEYYIDGEYGETIHEKHRTWD